MAADPTHDGHEHGHDPHLAHHFDTRQQQFDSEVQGMWLFLATEILLFAGLFCAYAVYRANHPEVFLYAHKYLDISYGAINTVILLFSSFTMAAAVWAAQHSKQGLLIGFLAITILCACGFMGIKYIEYKHKWHDGLLWGTHFKPTYEPGDHGHGGGHGGEHDANAAGHAEDHGDGHGDTPPADNADAHADEAAHDDTAGELAAAETADAAEPNVPVDPDATSWTYTPSSTGPRGLLRPGVLDEAGAELLKVDPEVRNVRTFFAVYFLMTGLHGIHVIAGMAAIGWLLVRSIKGHFSAAYFTPVPLVGLYWHVVDLVWIYLFPLLYLIH
jgi:cytochrome c oxidase subunit 3